MAAPPERPAPRLRLAWFILPVLALLVALPLGWPPDGVERAPLAQFLGRFHPSLVHLPIALILLVAALEVFSAFGRWGSLRAATGFVLACTAVVAVVAALDGWLLARSGGYGGHLITTHMWGSVIFAGCCVLLAWLRPTFSTPASAGIGAYRLFLAATLGLMAWSSHQGGSLTHGAGYLTAYMPGRLRALLHVEAPKPKPVLAAVPRAAADATLYRERVMPLLRRSCVSCHGPQKTKGGLRMDTFARLMAGGEDGVVLAPWYPQRSELIRRVTLPPDDDDFMPSGGKKPLTAAEVKLLVDWIAAGATETEPVDAGTPRPVVGPGR